MTHARSLADAGGRIGRRGVLMGLGGLCAAAGPGFPRSATLMISGPASGRLDRLVDLIVPPLSRALPPGTRLLRQTVGGVDGVTGANQFEALVAPDGATALIVPGSAPLAWLAGDQRAQFDPSRWVPAWAALGSAVLLARGPLTPGRPLRIPALGPTGPALPMLLALNLLGVGATLLPPAAQGSPGDVDAVFLSGPATHANAAALAGSGLLPVLALGALDAGGGWSHDPAFPDLPTAVHQAGSRVPASHPLQAALRAAAAAVQLDAALVLPRLCPADAATTWQRAFAGVAGDADLLTAAAAAAERPADAAHTSAALLAITAGAPARPALRQWLDTHYA